MAAAQMFVVLMGAYLGAGLLFGIPFAFFGVETVDPVTRDAGKGFRLIILPGSILLWPLLLTRYLKRRQGNDSEVQE